MAYFLNRHYLNHSTLALKDRFEFSGIPFDFYTFTILFCLHYDYNSLKCCTFLQLLFALMKPARLHIDQVHDGWNVAAGGHE